MPNDNRYKLAQDIVKSTGSYSGASPVVDTMKKRRAALDRKKTTGGMFDFIFKKRMEREKAMSNIYGE